jgi:Protein of unknown function (DUF4232)
LPGLATALLLAGLAGCGEGTTTVENTVTTLVTPPEQNLVLARRTGDGPRVTPGPHISSASPCTREVGGLVKKLYIVPDSGGCVRVTPRDRLLIVNSTGTGAYQRGAVEVEVTLGDYEARLAPFQSALFAAPAGSYLGLGLHQVGARSDGQAIPPSVLVLPEGCALPARGPGRNPPLPPGEGVCFAEGAPPCKGSKLSVRVGKGGGAGGSVYQTFQVLNRSGETCTVTGFPRLVAVDRGGGSIGPAAERTAHPVSVSGRHPKTIVLEAGGIATFGVRYGEADNFSPPCGARTSVALRVTIPSAGALPSLPYRMERCPGGVQGFDVGRIE